VVDTDLGDHVTFKLERSTPTGLGENQPGFTTRRYVFACIDTDHDTQIDTVQVDLVVGPPPVGHPEIIEPANRLHLRRPLVTYPYRLYPVADQIADKVCATIDTNYPSGKRSSRVKDLVDLVDLATTQRLDLDELRTAIEAKRAISQIRPFDQFDIPHEWIRTYAKTANGVPGASALTADTAAALVASVVDPALHESENSMNWDPHLLRWVGYGSL
jgi:nucleotidyltransferase AbiEii toxin of type IV toxin-antitoxin system